MLSLEIVDQLTHYPKVKTKNYLKNGNFCSVFYKVQIWFVNVYFCKITITKKSTFKIIHFQLFICFRLKGVKLNRIKNANIDK